jgi:NADH-quinone oxidoreductase subunit C
MTVQEAAAAVQSELSDLAESIETRERDVLVRCAAKDIPQVMARLRDGATSCDYLTFVTAADYPPSEDSTGRMDLWYHLRSLSLRIEVLVTASIARDGESVRTVSDLYPTAVWHERECYDLLGVVFAGHPGLTRILLPDDWRGHPLRKDYTEDMNDLTYTTEKRWPEMSEARKPGG